MGMICFKINASVEFFYTFSFRISYVLKLLILTYLVSLGSALQFMYALSGMAALTYAKYITLCC
jgi:hypothetical protein